MMIDGFDTDIGLLIERHDAVAKFSLFRAIMHQLL